MKKRLLGIGLAAIMTVAMAMPVFADGDTVLTTTVPDAQYTLNIPENQAISFGATNVDIGNVTVSNSSGFANGKNLNVTVTYDSFKADGVSTTIPYTLHHRSVAEYDRKYDRKLTSGDVITFRGQSAGNVEELAFLHSEEYDNSYYGKQIINHMGNFLSIYMSSDDWGRALAGDYSSTITFASEVVVEE